jgi:hypothetical protein
MTAEKPKKQATDLFSYQLRSRTVPHSEYQPRRAHKPQTAARLPTISEGCKADEHMATGGERRVTLTSESHDKEEDDKTQYQMLQLATQIDQLQLDLRRVNESNRALT